MSSYRESECIELRNGISTLARAVLSRMQKKELRGAVLEYDKPFVEPLIRHLLWKLDNGLVAVWELQVQGECRWHLYKHWTPGKSDIPTHFMMLQDPARQYVPLDMRVVDLVREALVISRDPVDVVKRWLDDEAKREINDKAELYDNCAAWWRYYRRLFARSAWGTVGSLWERGVQLPYEVKQEDLQPKKAIVQAHVDVKSASFVEEAA